MKSMFPSLLFILVFLATTVVQGQSIITVTDADLQGGQTYEWTRGNVYLLDGIVALEAGGTLIIEPGTIIKGKAPQQDGDFAALVIEQGARIEAVGTAAEPIIFTAEADELFDPEDIGVEGRLWFGVQINGRAPIDVDAAHQDTLPGSTYFMPVGGSDAMDDSGILRYVSIRYAGANADLTSTGNSAGLTLFGVGEGSCIENVETYGCRGTGIAVRGGTVNLFRMVSAANLGHSFRLDFGYTGTGQFWLAQDIFFPEVYGFPTLGIYGEENGNPLFTAPNLANLSIVGRSQSGIFVPRGDGLGFSGDAGGIISNSFITGFTTSTLGLFDDEDDQTTSALDRLESGALQLTNTLFNRVDEPSWDWSQFTGTFRSLSEPGDPAGQSIVQAAIGGTNDSSSDGEMLGSCVLEPECYDPRPRAGSNLLGTAQSLANPDFVATTYRGAFGPQDNWAAGWSYTFNSDSLQTISGHVTASEDDDCASPGGTTYEGVLLTFTQGSTSITVSTDSTGYYFAYVPAGDLEVTATPPSSLWNACGLPATVSVPPTTSVTRNIQFVPLRFCSDPFVEISANFLRRCFESTYRVEYGNSGTLPTGNTIIEVVLDTALTYLSSSIAPIAQSGDTLHFDVGVVDPLQTGSFTILVQVSCEVDLGFVHCSSAEVVEGNGCDGPLGPRLQANGYCDGDSIRLQLTNIGDEATTVPVSYIVIEDEVMLLEASDITTISPGEIYELSYEAGQRTFHLAAPALPEDENGPITRATVACVPVPNVPLNSFPENDAFASKSIDCQNNIGAFDPNDKIGFPLGVGADNAIPEGQRINYRIRFQNTGTDTAFTVRIVDTLSDALDLSTFRIGNASHDFTWRIGEDRDLTLLFDDIMLPDSFVNEPASNGFVTFSVDVNREVPIGTQIFNEAGIYFDFNEPIITNRTLHTISDFLNPVSGLKEPAARQTAQRAFLYPQPASELLNVKLLEADENASGYYEIFTLDGRPALSGQYSNATFAIDVSQLPAGLYAYLLRDTQGRPITSGRVILR